MEEEFLLKQPTDRRLGNENLPPGPPGAEEERETKKDEKDFSSLKSSRRKSPSPSTAKRKASPQRGRRSPSSPSPPSGRRHRSPSPPARRNRFRYSPDRRSNRRRSPEPRDRYRERERYRAGRGRRDESGSRSRSRSPSSASRRSGGRGTGRWSPKKKKPSSPPPPPPPISVANTRGSTMIAPTGAAVMQQPVMATGGQYGMMQPPQAQLYGGDAYAAAYGAPYGVPPTHAGYAMPAAANYNPSYPPPNAWGGHDGYAQQTWLQQPTVPDHNPQIAQQTEQAAHTARNNFPVNSNVGAETAPGTNEVNANANAAHDAAVAQEAENQREELKKQRTSYVKKNSLLKKELRMLKDQRKDLDSGNVPLSPTTKGFIDENEKLQSQIIKKIATIENVIEMLTGVIGEEHVDREETAPVPAVNTKERLNVTTPKLIDNTPQKGSSQIQSQQNRTISNSSNSSRGGGGQGLTTTSSGTSSSSSTSSSSDSSSSSDDEEDDKSEIIKPAIRPMIIKEEDDDSSPERLKHKVMESMKSKQRTLSVNAQREFPGLNEKLKLEKIAGDKQEQPRFNYAFYDPEMHWCQRCNVFPKTAKDYLNHLHSIEHLEKETAPETPWHSIVVEDNFPNYENAPTKRMPIRGITFFLPATAWYCKLCCIWMGDLHCASMHLKSRQHSNRYTTFLERNPNFEMNWLADRQRVLNEKNLEAAAPQITAVSTTAAEERDNKKSKKLEEKTNKKHKKNSEKKDKKKKKKRTKKRKKVQESSSDSSSSESSSSDESDHAAQKKKKPPKELSPIKELDNPNPGASIRVTMRKSGRSRFADSEVPPPPPPPPPSISMDTKSNAAISGGANNWNIIQGSSGKSSNDAHTDGINTKPDDAMMQQWNTVQPVISDNEKKLLEQLKGKLKTTKSATSTTTTAKDTNKNVKEPLKSDTKENRDNRTERSSDNRRERNTSADRYRNKRSRSLSRSPTRSRSRGRDWRRARSRSLRRRSRSRGRRSRSRSRGRYSPVGRGNRRRRSRSRRRRSRSRSRNRRIRRSRTRSGSRGGTTTTTSAIVVAPSSSRVEKPLIQHSEFRPRIPEKEKEKDKKPVDSKDKKEIKKPVKSSNSSSTTTGKKLPFIGKMPVFKKQATGSNENDSADVSTVPDIAAQNLAAAIYMSQSSNSGVHSAIPPPPPPRAPAPTAAQINMAMMEDVYGNAPPFHPEAGVMHTGMDYDDLMPDPVQFVNLMAQAPPPPAEEAENEADVLPPGIDEMETEEFVQKPMPEVENDGGNLPKDLEEALNIIFPGERKPEDDAESERAAKEAGETQIIVEEPVMQMDELYKEGIHMVTIEETSLMAMDEASRLSMNEPLVFNKAPSTTVSSSNSSSRPDEKTEEEPPIVESAMPNLTNAVTQSKNDDEIKEKFQLDISIQNESNDMREESEVIKTESVMKQIPDEIAMPSIGQSDENSSAAVDFNLDDIPNPPAPLTESEKRRRQEELDELAMLGIDADDMAAQRM